MTDLSNSRIFYYCYDHNRPSGGEKHSYQHVDVLNDNGYEAYAFHRTTGVRLSWFENATRVVDLEQFQQRYRADRDIIVFPEDFDWRTMDSFPGLRVVFNKNVFHGFRSLLNLPPVCNPYLSPTTIGVLSVSDHNKRLLSLSYPQLPIHRVYSHIRRDLFSYRTLVGRKRQIVASTKALPLAASVHELLASRARHGPDAMWNWVWLAGRGEREVAELLKESLVLVFLSVEEGLPRLVLEAMASGCLVVAFRCGPLTEVLPQDSGFDFGDIEGIVTWLEALGAAFPSDVSRYRAMTVEALKVTRQFSLAHQRRSVCRAWKRLLAARDLVLLGHKRTI
jgi:hypothetical protein